MKKFREYISEEVVPTALVKDGSIDLDKEEVRASINMALAKVTSDSSITPYIALNRISKALSYFHIIIPKRVYLEGAKGVEVHELRQFGDRMGMTDQGEFVHDVPGKYYLFIQYGMNSPMNYGGQLAYPTMGGTFRVMAKVVDQAELDRLMSMAELSLAEECNAEMQQARAKMMALKEPMKDLDVDGSPSTDAGVATSMRKKDKKLSAGSLEEEGFMDKVRSMNPFTQLGDRLGTPGAKAAEPDKRIMGNPDTAKKTPPKEGSKDSPFPAMNEDEQIDEISKELAGRYLGQAGYDRERARGEADVHVDSKKKHERDWATNQYKRANRRAKGAHLAINKLVGKYAKVPATEETQIDELSYDTVARYHRKAADRYQTGEEPYEKRKKGREIATRKRAGGMMGIPKAKVMAKEGNINEKLTKGMSAGDVIHDFVHSDDPKFKGKSKKERQKMALGAYYGMHPEKSRKE